MNLAKAKVKPISSGDEKVNPLTTMLEALKFEEHIIGLGDVSERWRGYHE